MMNQCIKRMCQQIGWASMLLTGQETREMINLRSDKDRQVVR